MTDYRLVERLPMVAEYRDLRRLSGLSARRALKPPSGACLQPCSRW